MKIADERARVPRVHVKLVEAIRANRRANSVECFKKHYEKRVRERERERERGEGGRRKVYRGWTTNCVVGDADEFIDATRRLELCELGEPRLTFAFFWESPALRVSSSFFTRTTAPLIARPRNRVKADSHSTTAPPCCDYIPPGSRLPPYLAPTLINSALFLQFPSAFLSNIPLPVALIFFFSNLTFFPRLKRKL